MALIGMCEADPAARQLLTRTLRRGGHEVVAARTGEEAIDLFGAQVPLDAVVLAVLLPDADGRDLCLALKARGQVAPVVFVTSQAALHHKLAGFAAGADDYLVKPFDPLELLARVEVLARVRHQPDPRPVVPLDPVHHALDSDAGRVELTPTEFRMLAAICARPGEVVRRRAVVDAAWPPGAMVSENTLDSFVRRVRAKLGEDCGVRIDTVRGVGFRAETAVRDLGGQGAAA